MVEYFFHPNIYSFGILNDHIAGFYDLYGVFSKENARKRWCIAGLEPAPLGAKWALLLFELLLPFFVNFWDQSISHSSQILGFKFFNTFFSDFEGKRNQISSKIEPLELPVKGINSIFSKKFFLNFLG